MRQPTEKQLATLAKLGYAGPSPVTLREASLLIGAKKNGASDEVAVRLLEKSRDDAEQRARIERKQQIAHVKAEIQEMIRSNFDDRRDGFEGMYAGFRFVEFEETVSSEERPYRGAFLPLRVAEQYPQLLLVETLDYEEVLTDDVIRKGTPVVVAPGKFKPYTGKRSSKQRSPLSLGLVGVILIAAAAAAWYVAGPFDAGLLNQLTNAPPAIPAAEPPAEEPVDTEPAALAPTEVAPETAPEAPEPEPMSAEPEPAAALPGESSIPVEPATPEELSAEKIEAAKWRTWTAGAFQARLKFVTLIGDTVRLQREDGSTLEVPLERLAAEDVDWIRKRRWLEPQP